MLRALRVSRASEVALKACRLFRCKECPRLLEPKHPRPSRLPQVGEFNVVVGLDVLSEKDSNVDEWTWLNVVDEGTGFQVCCLLFRGRSRTPTAQRSFVLSRSDGVDGPGMPEKGLIVDRAKYFLASLAQRMTEEGCHVDAIGKSFPLAVWFLLKELEEYGKSTLRKNGLVRTTCRPRRHDDSHRCSELGPEQSGQTFRFFAGSVGPWSKHPFCQQMSAKKQKFARIGRPRAQLKTPTTRFFRKSQLSHGSQRGFL